jgi:molybdopterin-binding protein
MTLSARNQLLGTIEEVQLGGVMGHVAVRVGENLILVAHRKFILIGVER